jgi:Tfp pilus assembly protein PilW
MNHLLGLQGQYQIKLFRSNEILLTLQGPNGITNVGKDKILDVMFFSSTQIAKESWFIGLIDSSGFGAGLSALDTMGSHAGWNEFTSFSEGTRVAWNPLQAASQSTTNSAAATFNINGSGTVKGVFVTSNSTKGGTTGTLWATATFSADVPVTNGDQLKVTYTVSA